MDFTFGQNTVSSVISCRNNVGVAGIVNDKSGCAVDTGFKVGIHNCTGGITGVYIA